jgi:hypothetical protein
MVYKIFIKYTRRTNEHKGVEIYGNAEIVSVTIIEK